MPCRTAANAGRSCLVADDEARRLALNCAMLPDLVQRRRTDRLTRLRGVIIASQIPRMRDLEVGEVVGADFWRQLRLLS